MRHNGPRYIAKYVRENDSLDNPGWKKLCLYVNKTKKMNRVIKANKAKYI